MDGRGAGVCRDLERHENRRGQRPPLSADELRRAIAGSNKPGAQLEFIVENASYFKVVTVAYQGGLRYPHLERVTGATDLLTTIATGRAPVTR